MASAAAAAAAAAVCEAAIFDITPPYAPSIFLAGARQYVGEGCRSAGGGASRVGCGMNWGPLKELTYAILLVSVARAKHIDSTDSLPCNSRGLLPMEITSVPTVFSTEPLKFSDARPFG